MQSWSVTWIIQRYFTSRFCILSSISIAFLHFFTWALLASLASFPQYDLIFSFYLFPFFVLSIPFHAGIRWIKIGYFVNNRWSFIASVSGIEICSMGRLWELPWFRLVTLFRITGLALLYGLRHSLCLSYGCRFSGLEMRLRRSQNTLTHYTLDGLKSGFWRLILADWGLLLFLHRRQPDIWFQDTADHHCHASFSSLVFNHTLFFV